MNLSAAIIVLSAAVSSATVSAHSYSHSISAKGSKASSKATKSKATKSKAAKAGSYSYSFSMSMSLPHCKKFRTDYDTGNEYIEIGVEDLVTPEAGQTFNYYSYTPATLQYECYEGGELGRMRFSADNQKAPDGTIAECDYEACYEEDCAPDCCCGNTVFIRVDD